MGSAAAAAAAGLYNILGFYFAQVSVSNSVAAAVASCSSSSSRHLFFVLLSRGGRGLAD